MKNELKIKMFPIITSTLRKDGFDEFEVHPCKVVDEDKTLIGSFQAIEQCEPEDAEFWSVYVHLTKGGLDCIADCSTEDEANELVQFLTDLITYAKIG